jgi:hypothetical protein
MIRFTLGRVPTRCLQRTQETSRAVSRHPSVVTVKTVAIPSCDRLVRLNNTRVNNEGPEALFALECVVQKTRLCDGDPSFDFVRSSIMPFREVFLPRPLRIRNGSAASLSPRSIHVRHLLERGGRDCSTGVLLCNMNPSVVLYIDSLVPDKSNIFEYWTICLSTLWTFVSRKESSSQYRWTLFAWFRTCETSQRLRRVHRVA